MDSPVLPWLRRGQGRPSVGSVIWSLIVGFWGVVTYCWSRCWGAVTYSWTGFWKCVGDVCNVVRGCFALMWRRCVLLARSAVFSLDDHKAYLSGFVAAVFAGLATEEGVRGLCLFGLFGIPYHLLGWLGCWILSVSVGLTVCVCLVINGRVYLLGRLRDLEDYIGVRVSFYAQKWGHSKNIVGGMVYGMLSGMLMGCSYWVTHVLLECDLCHPDLEDCRPDLESLVSYICLAMAWMSASFGADRAGERARVRVGERATVAGGSELDDGVDRGGERATVAGGSELDVGVDRVGERATVSETDDVVDGAKYGVSGCLTFIPLGMVLQSQWISWPHFLMGFPTMSVSEVMILPMWQFLLECAQNSRDAELAAEMR